VYKVAQRLREVLGVHYVGEIIEGVEIPHAHVKLIPFGTIAEFKNTPNVTDEPDHGALAEVAKKLKF
jgi:diadenosine tetraphosphate (Ap4A) HIT family hydrolase